MITAEEPKVTDTGRYSIGEAAKILGLHRNTLRQHTEDGYIKCGFRRTSKRRFYTGTDILKYWKSFL